MRRKRELLSIPAFVARWTEHQIAVFGTDDDHAVAEILGRSYSADATQRAVRGIPA